MPHFSYLKKNVPKFTFKTITRLIEKIITRLIDNETIDK